MTFSQIRRAGRPVGDAHLDEAAQLGAGEAGLPAVDPLATLGANLLDARKLSIYGGSNEVQRNLIAGAIL